jgi:hypothetical protein
VNEVCIVAAFFWRPENFRHGHGPRIDHVLGMLRGFDILRPYIALCAEDVFRFFRR